VPSTDEHKDILISPVSSGSGTSDAASSREYDSEGTNGNAIEDITVRQSHVSFQYRQAISFLVAAGLMGFSFSGIWPDFIALYPMRVVVVTAAFFLLSLIVFIFDFLIPILVVLLDRLKYYKIRKKYGYPLPAYIRNFCLYVLGICAITTSVVNFGVAIRDYPILEQTIAKTTQELRLSADHDKISEELKISRYRAYDIAYMHRLGIPVPEEFQTNAGYMNTKGNFHFETRYHPKTLKIIRFLISSKHQFVSNWGDYVTTVRAPDSSPIHAH